MLFDRTNKLQGCHPKLFNLVHLMSEHMDLIVVCGHRNQPEQDAAFARGASKLKYPNSKHNSVPSKAVDIAPCSPNGSSIDWNDIERFKDMMELAKSMAAALNIEIVCGGDWTMKDYPHIQIVG